MLGMQEALNRTIMFLYKVGMQINLLSLTKAHIRWRNPSYFQYTPGSLALFIGMAFVNKGSSK